MASALNAPPREPSLPSSAPSGTRDEGPFRAHQVRDGDPYELSEGHPIECMSSGQRHGTANLRGGAFLAADPDVDGAGVDVGVEFNGGKNLRAPDVSVGLVEDKPGWAPILPPLAVEFADTGQDEHSLGHKIRELLSNGTRFVWVVRLSGPRRVEVHEPRKRMRTLISGQVLLAPGVLRNPVPVDAFFERDVAQELTLRNLLNRKGIASLEAYRQQGLDEGRRQGLDEGRQQGLDEGRQQGLLEAVFAMADLLGLELKKRRQAQLARMSVAQLESQIAYLRKHRAWPDR